MSHFVVIVYFTLRPGNEQHFIQLVTDNARDSLREEPGCRQFDVVRVVENSAAVYLYEIYDSEEAFKAHLATAHFKSFDQATADIVLTKTVILGHRLS